MHRPRLLRSILLLGYVIVCLPGRSAEFTTREEEQLSGLKTHDSGSSCIRMPSATSIEGSFDPDIRPETKRAEEAAMFDKVGERCTSGRLGIRWTLIPTHGSICSLPPGRGISRSRPCTCSGSAISIVRPRTSTSCPPSTNRICSAACQGRRGTNHGHVVFRV